MSVWGIHLLRKISAGPSETLGFINHLRRLQGLPQFSSEDDAYASGYINSPQYYDALDAYNAARGLPPGQRPGIDDAQLEQEDAESAADRYNRANNPATINTATERPRIQIPGLGPGSRVALNGENLEDPDIYEKPTPAASTAPTSPMSAYGNFARTQSRQSTLMRPKITILDMVRRGAQTAAQAPAAIRSGLQGLQNRVDKLKQQRQKRVNTLMDIHQQNQPQSVFNQPAQQKQPLLPPRRDTLQPGTVFQDMATNRSATPAAQPKPSAPSAKSAPVVQRTSAQTITGKTVNFQPGMDAYRTKSGGIIQVESGTKPPISGAELISRAPERPATPQTNTDKVTDADITAIDANGRRHYTFKPDGTPNNTGATSVNNAAASQQQPSKPSAVTPQQRYDNALKYYERTGNKLEASRLNNALKYQKEKYAEGYGETAKAAQQYLKNVPDVNEYPELLNRVAQRTAAKNAPQQVNKSQTLDPALRRTAERNADQMAKEDNRREDAVNKMNAEFDAIGKSTPPAAPPKNPDDVANIQNGATKVAQLRDNGAPKAQYN